MCRHMAVAETESKWVRQLVLTYESILDTGEPTSHQVLNWHGRIQNILAIHEYENTDWFFNMVLCVFMVKIVFNLDEPVKSQVDG